MRLTAHMKAATVLKSDCCCCPASEETSLGSSVFFFTFLHPTKHGLLYLGQREVPLILESVPLLWDREGRGCSSSTVLSHPESFNICQQ